MRYIKTFEKYITNHDEYQVLNLIDFNKNFNKKKISKLDKLKSLLIGKIIEFRGIIEGIKYEDKKYILHKYFITDIFLTGIWSYKFETESGQRYNVDNNYPIKIYTMESDARKYNI